MGHTCRLPDEFLVGITPLNLARPNLARNIWQNVTIAMEHTHILIECSAWNVAIKLNLGPDVDHKLSKLSNQFDVSLEKIIRSPRSEGQIFGLNARPQMRTSSWPWPWPFSISMIKFSYISSKYSNVPITPIKSQTWVIARKFNRGSDTRCWKEWAFGWFSYNIDTGFSRPTVGLLYLQRKCLIATKRNTNM